MMTTQNRIKTVLTLAVVAMAILVAVANAIVIDPATGVTASSEIGGIFDRKDDYIIDGSGLTAGAHNNTVKGNMWLSTGTAFGGEDLDPSVTFDLGAVYTISSFRVWNYNEVNLSARGVNGVSVKYGTTAALGSTVPGITNFAQAPGTNGYTGEEFDSFTPFQARYIKFDINSNHGGDNAFYGLSEVQFYGSSDPNFPFVDAGVDMISWSGQAVAMDPNIVEAEGSDWISLTYLWTAEPNGIGDPNLDVVITGADTENASVTITKAEPTGDATVVRMTLAVNSEGREGAPVTDAMTISVYDDACLAAKAAGTAAIDPTDIDANCITAFPDFALMAAMWFDDYTLTEAIVK